MKNVSRTEPMRWSHRALIVYFSLVFLLALFPPFYLSVSDSSLLILGIPLPVAYWLAIAIMLIIGLSVKYALEPKSAEQEDIA